MRWAWQPPSKALLGSSARHPVAFSWAPWAPGVIGAVIMAWVIIYVWRRLIVNPDPPLPSRGEQEANPEPVQARP